MKKLPFIVHIMILVACINSCTEKGTNESANGVYEMEQAIGQCNEELEACTESLMFTYTQANCLPYNRRRVGLLEHKDSLLHQLRLLQCNPGEQEVINSEFAQWRCSYESKCKKAEDSICTATLGAGDYDETLQYYEQQADFLYNRAVWMIHRLNTIQTEQ